MAAPKLPPALDLPSMLEALAGQLRLATTAPPVAPPPQEPRYLGVKEYAKRVGVSATTVRSWLKDGLPHTNAPGRVRVIVAEADQWIEQGPGAKGKPTLSVVNGGKS